MTEIFHSSTSNVMRFLLDVAGLTNASSGLSIATICSNEATPTVYAVDSSNVETITTLGTYAAPSSGKCRFKEVDATNTPKLYEFQFADARFAVTGAKWIDIFVTGAGTDSPPIRVMLPQGITESGKQYQAVSTLASSNTAIAAATWGTDPIAYGSAGTFGYSLNMALSNTATIAGKLTGITTLAGWLRLALRKDAAVATDHATEAAEINADTGTGAGSYANTTESQEAIRDAIPIDTGSGSVAYIYGPVNDSGGDPLDGVEVWVTSSTSSTPRIAQGYTNATGYITFQLDPGAYYFWAQLSGYNFDTPDGPVTVS